MDSHKLMDLFFLLIKLKAGKASPSDSLYWRNPLWLISFFSMSVRSMKMYDSVERGKSSFCDIFLTATECVEMSCDVLDAE